jgi:hypothetical protein
VGDAVTGRDISGIVSHYIDAHKDGRTLEELGQELKRLTRPAVGSSSVLSAWAIGTQRPSSREHVKRLQELVGCRHPEFGVHAIEAAMPAEPSRGRAKTRTRALGKEQPTRPSAPTLTAAAPGGAVAGNPPSPGAGSDPPNEANAPLDAYVTTDVAPVYPQPDVKSQPIKYKYKADRVGVLSRPLAPLGWTVVSTPRDAPGYNWMQTAALTLPTSRTSPLPGAR